jgi:hypothetical protein
VHPPEGERRYKWVEFQVTLDQPDMLAYDLFPHDITREEKAESIIAVSPQFKFLSKLVTGTEAGVEVDGKFERKLSQSIMQPIISAFGAGEQKFYWKFDAPENQNLIPGSRHVFAVLRLPADAKTVEGKIFLKRLWKSLASVSGLQPRSRPPSRNPSAWPCRKPRRASMGCCPAAPVTDAINSRPGARNVCTGCFSAEDGPWADSVFRRRIFTPSVSRTRIYAIYGVYGVSTLTPAVLILKCLGRKRGRGSKG